MLKYLTKNIQLLLVYEKEINIAKGGIIFVFAILDQWPLMMTKINVNTENILSCHVPISLDQFNTDNRFFGSRHF